MATQHAFNYQVRPLQQQEWATWRDLQHRMIATDPASFSQEAADWTKAGDEEWQARLADALRPQAVFVLECGPEIVGFASVLPSISMACASYWNGIYIEPAHRERGHAHNLIDEIIKWSYRMDKTDILMKYRAGNEAIAAIAHDYRFVPHQEEADVVWANGETDTRLFRRKTLVPL